MPRGGARVPPIVQDQIFKVAVDYKRRHKGNSPSRSQLRREFMKVHKRSIAWKTFQEKIERLIERGLLERADDAQLIVPDSEWRYPI